MGKIFGISDLPVQTLNKNLQPFQDLVPKPVCKFIRKIKLDSKLEKTPAKDIFLRTVKTVSNKKIK